MEQIVLLNKNNPPPPPFTKGGLGGIRGFTLVEVMIALVITLLVFLALMQTALIGIDSNMRNILRNEAVSIAEMRINQAMNIPFVSLVSDSGSLSGYDCPSGFSSTGIPVERNLRNIQGFDFCTNLTCSDFGIDTSCATDDSDNKQVNITVGWRWKGENYTHRVSTIRKS